MDTYKKNDPSAARRLEIVLTYPGYRRNGLTPRGALVPYEGEMTSDGRWFSRFLTGNGDQLTGATIHRILYRSGGMNHWNNDYRWRCQNVPCGNISETGKKIYKRHPNHRKRRRITHSQACWPASWRIYKIVGSCCVRWTSSLHLSKVATRGPY